MGQPARPPRGLRLVGWALVALLCMALAGCNPLHPSITQHFVFNLSGAVSLQGTAEYTRPGAPDCTEAAVQTDGADYITVNETHVSWELGVFGQPGHQQLDPSANVNGASWVMVGNDEVDPRNTYSNDAQDASGSITVNPDGGGVIRLDNWQNSLGESLSGTIAWTCTAG